MIALLLEGMVVAAAVEQLPRLTRLTYRSPEWSLRSDWYDVQRDWSRRAHAAGWTAPGIERWYL